MSDNANDKEIIKKTIQCYIDGGISGRGDDMKPAFHEDASLFGHIGDSLLSGSIKNLFDWVDENGPATELQAEIDDVNIIETIAVARVELYNWTDYRFTNLFTLIKIGNTWKIINEVFHLHD